MSDVKLPDPMTYCKARMIDASLYGRNLESEMFGKIIDELTRHNALVEAVAWERECECFDRWATHTCQPVTYEWDQVIFAARAEVDRILSEEK